MLAGGVAGGFYSWTARVLADRPSRSIAPSKRSTSHYLLYLEAGIFCALVPDTLLLLIQHSAEFLYRELPPSHLCLEKFTAY